MAEVSKNVGRPADYLLALERGDQVRTYKTKSGDTWDIIAFTQYPKLGRELLTSLLIENNPEHINTVIFPAGVVLTLPDVSESVSKTLPPWMR